MGKKEDRKEVLLMKPFMPPLADFQEYLANIWPSRRLTNNGPVHADFEQALCDYLGVKYISLTANGTLALVLALKALDLKGEVITTPFTAVATAQAIHWNNLKPVFVDINDSDFNIDIDEIERAITNETSAILPVHIFGNPCNISGIEKLAGKYNLKVIYDAAHCFGVKQNGISICNFGDLSVLSFHATKVFNCFEGGAIISHDESTKRYIDALINTGLDQQYNLAGYGMNAKMNEIQSAFGLVQLKYIDSVIASRKAATMQYRSLLKDITGIGLPVEKESVTYNYTYFPVTVDKETFGTSRDELASYLERQKICTRKYFFPLLSDYQEFSLYKTRVLPVAERIASNILCLPLYHDLTGDEINAVAGAIRQRAPR